MNSRRKAELQRRLTLNVVPRPPADLLERIKSDIPDPLEQGVAPRRRFGTSGLRIAASVLVLLGSVIAAFVLLLPREEAKIATALPSQPRVVVPAVTRQAAETTGTSATAEIRLEMSSEIPAEPASPPVVQVARAEPRALSDTPATGAPERAFAPEIAAASTGAVAGNVAAVAAEERAGAERDAEPVVEVATAAPAARPAEAAEAAPPPAAARAEGSLARQKAAAPALATAAFAQDQARGNSAFGVSLDRGVFETVRSAIERGATPAPETVDVEALVNYFAGAPATPPREGLRLEVEASPAPVAPQRERVILRVTVDAPRTERSSSEAAATDAAVGLEIDPVGVASFRAIGDGSPLTRESVLRRNTSVTLLYELVLRPRIHPQQRLASVRLTWRSVEDGGSRTAERRIAVRDLVPSWARASWRHRLASLGASWGETLKGTEGGPDVARRAEELAAQSPGDTRARELARLASASWKLRHEGP